MGASSPQHVESSDSDDERGAPVDRGPAGPDVTRQLPYFAPKRELTNLSLSFSAVFSCLLPEILILKLLI